MDEQKNPQGLDRYLSKLDVWAMAFGVMVGWGAFVMPGTTFLPVAGPFGTLLAMLISTLIVLVIGMNFAFLMNRNPRTGGVYSYTKVAFGRDHAFLCSWFLCLSYITVVFLNASALFVMVKTVFGTTLQIGYHYTVAGEEIYLPEVGITILALLFIGLLYVMAKPGLQYLQTILSVLMAVGIVVAAVMCIPNISVDTLLDFGTEGIKPAYGIFSIVILAPWAFVGFEVTSFDTTHFKFDIKKSKSILLTSILAAGFSYAAMGMVSVSAIPDGYASWGDYIAVNETLIGVQSVPTFYAAKAIMGTAGLVIVTVTAFAAILTGIIGGYRATMRVLSTMAEDRILSEMFSKTTYSILFVMVLSILISLLGRNNLTWFVDLTAFGAIVSFGYTSAAAYKIARTENNRPTMVTGIIGAVISAAFVIVQLVPRLTAMEAMGSEAFLLLALWCLLGFIFYWRTVIHSTLSEYSGISLSGIVLFALLVYSVLLWLAKLLVRQESMDAIRPLIVRGGIIILIIIFIGLIIMLYIQELIRSKHEALERDKIRAVEGSLAKSQFLFNMSHDIRTPMNAIIGYTHLAMQEEGSPTVKAYLEKIDSSSQHLLSLINDILEMSRIETGKVELEYAPESLIAIFKAMQDLFSEQMRQKNIDFSVHTSQVHNPYVWCDRKNLNRVLLNVLSNAFKFTPEGGTINFSLWEIGNGEDGYGSYEMRISDSGIGMSKEFVERMFNAFERERTSTDSGIEGTGLGLAITKSIVDLMGGTIEVLTSPGSGTEIIIRLKMRLADASEVKDTTRKAEPDETGQSTDFSGKRVLLVEDNMVNLEIAKMILTQLGFEVDTADNGQIAVDMVEEAVRQAAESAGGEAVKDSTAEAGDAAGGAADKAAGAPGGMYDLILMDIQMPVMDGYEATAKIRAMTDPAASNVPIVAMTANAFAEDVKAAEDAGMQGHIAKPVDIPAMIETITEVLERSKREK